MAMPRRCGTCVHHVPGSNRNSGQCVHPARQFSGGVAVLVRSAELACRTDWGSDSWEPKPSDFLIDLIVWGPFQAELPPIDDLPADLVSLLINSNG
jgi:hypothetical protein